MSQFFKPALPVLRTTIMRPSALPSTRVLLPFTQTCSLTAQANAAAKRNAKISPREKRPVRREPTPPPSKSPEELSRSAYLVARTPSLNLPVYRDWSAGGNKITTLIRKISGDSKLLKKDMAKALAMDEKDIRINPTTLALEVRGDQFLKVKAWLLQSGF